MGKDGLNDFLLEVIQNEKELSGNTEEKLKTVLDEFSKKFE